MGNLPKKCVVYASTPLHAISAVSAIITQNPDLNIKVKILLQWPGPVDEASPEITKIISEMLSQFKYIESVIAVPEVKLDEALAHNSKTKLFHFFSSILGWKEVNEIYYSHDLGGYMYYSLASTYKNAITICYGDSMGIVAERDEYLSDLRQKKVIRKSKNPIASICNMICKFINVLKSIIRFLSAKKKQYKLSFEKNKTSDDKLSEFISANFYPDLAILIMPVGQSKNFLKNLNLKICDQKTVSQIINTCIASCSDLNVYIDELLLTFSKKRKFVLLTENFAECNFMDFENEIKMYCHFIESHCSPGDVILLKSHPGEILPRNQKITEALGSKYQVVELMPKFKRYPIEIWGKLVNESSIISTGSTILNLKYLYDLNLIIPLDTESIEYWFPKDRWGLIKEAMMLYVEPLKRLANWDGNSILWNYE